MNIRRVLRAPTRLIAAMAVTAGMTLAHAQGFPSKPITIVAPFVAGSTTDVVARAFATDFGTALKSPVIVENRPGANQTVAGAHVYRLKPDGYTLFMVVIPTGVAPSIQAKLPYEGARSFTPVSDVLKIGFMLVTAPGVQARNLQEFISLVRADPGKQSYGSTGVSTSLHLYAEMFNKEIGVKTLHVPYKGSNEVIQDLVADRITYAFLPTGAMEFVRAGKLKGIGLAADKRDAAYPELPTMEEAGMPNFRAEVDIVLVAPPKLPPDVLEKLNAAANQVLSNPVFQNRVKPIGSVQVSRPATPAQVGAYITSEEARWDNLVKSANIQLE